MTCFKEIIEKISKKFQLGKVVLVGDRGMITRSNIAGLKDEEDLQFALDLGAEYISLSFVRRASDMADLRRVIRKDGGLGMLRIRRGDRLILLVAR